jgi:hypothetical protein
MSQTIQIRRDTDVNRLACTPNSGELFYTTDLKELWEGDGVTAGGNLAAATTLVLGADATPAAAATLAITSATRFAQLVQRVIAGAGTGAYVYNITLAHPTANGVGPLPGAVIKLYLEWPASANPTFNVYDSSTAGTLLKGPLTNPNPEAGEYYFIEAAWIAGAWKVIFCNWID